MCYNCLMKLKKWAKMTAEIAVIQEELTTYLQQSQLSRLSGNTCTLSEAKDVLEDQNKNLAPIGGGSY